MPFLREAMFRRQGLGWGPQEARSCFFPFLPDEDPREEGLILFPLLQVEGSLRTNPGLFFQSFHLSVNFWKLLSTSPSTQFSL